jgi:hypothetical protein
LARCRACSSSARAACDASRAGVAGTVLTSLRLLLAEPNADDPLMDEIAAELRSDPARFRRAATEHTRIHARPAALGAAPSLQVPSGSAGASTDAGPLARVGSSATADATGAPAMAAPSSPREAKRQRVEPESPMPRE